MIMMVEESEDTDDVGPMHWVHFGLWLLGLWRAVRWGMDVCHHVGACLQVMCQSRPTATSPVQVPAGSGSESGVASSSTGGVGSPTAPPAVLSPAATLRSRKKSEGPGTFTSLRCHCGYVCRRRVVKEGGPNAGRLYVSCELPCGHEDRCKFFQWI